MFQWDKSIKALGLPVARVLHLFRSMRDVQLALPGLPAQEASAYLCQYKGDQGVGTAAVFHLHKSGQLAFYVDSPCEVPAGKADSVLDQTLMFVESMGFLMTDLDIHLLSAGDREMLWSSLPLENGLQAVEKAPAPKPAPLSAPSAGPSAKAPAAKPAAAVSAPTPAEPVRPSQAVALEAKPAPAVFVAAPEPGRGVAVPAAAGADDQANVDDLLAAVEELRTRRPGVRARKKPPTPEELRRRRQELRENIGRVLASL